MYNKYLRLFVAQTRIMTAEKMKLDRFCQHGEYFAYKIALPPEPSSSNDEVKFVFQVDIETSSYYFTDDDIVEEEFTEFEDHLSEFLNELFQRKLEYEGRNELFKKVMQKLVDGLSEEEQHCLATNIDANTANVLKALGVKPETL